MDTFIFRLLYVGSVVVFCSSRHNAILLVVGTTVRNGLANILNIPHWATFGFEKLTSLLRKSLIKRV